MHNNGFVKSRQALEARGKEAEAEPPLVQQQRAQCGILVLAIVSSLHHNDINTCPLLPSTPPLDQDLDTITHPGDMITSVTALSLFCPVWQQQRSICLCLNRDNINMENIPRTSEIKYQETGY